MTSGSLDLNCESPFFRVVFLDIPIFVVVIMVVAIPATRMFLDHRQPSPSSLWTHCDLAHFVDTFVCLKRSTRGRGERGEGRGGRAASALAQKQNARKRGHKKMRRGVWHVVG